MSENTADKNQIGFANAIKESGSLTAFAKARIDGFKSSETNTYKESADLFLRAKYLLDRVEAHVNDKSSEIIKFIISFHTFGYLRDYLSKDGTGISEFLTTPTEKEPEVCGFYQGIPFYMDKSLQDDFLIVVRKDPDTGLTSEILEDLLIPERKKFISDFRYFLMELNNHIGEFPGIMLTPDNTLNQFTIYDTDRAAIVGSIKYTPPEEIEEEFKAHLGEGRIVRKIDVTTAKEFFEYWKEHKSHFYKTTNTGDFVYLTCFDCRIFYKIPSLTLIQDTFVDFPKGFSTDRIHAAEEESN